MKKGFTSKVSLFFISTSIPQIYDKISVRGDKDVENISCGG